VRAGRTERGSATLLGVVLAAILVAIAVTAAWWVAVVDLRHRAGIAADMAALAGAQAVQRGVPACPAAQRVAAANAAQLTRCQLLGSDVVAEAQMSGTVRLLGREMPVQISRRARAGP
jgi:secretion/DNA translocation related TadE-like protein